MGSQERTFSAAGRRQLCARFRRSVAAVHSPKLDVRPCLSGRLLRDYALAGASTLPEPEQSG
jgi:hypothetical protein